MKRASPNERPVQTTPQLPRRTAPDYFVGIRVFSSVLPDIRQQIISKTPQAEIMMLDPCESHVTLGVLKVEGGSPGLSPKDSLQQVIRGFTKGASRARDTVGRFPMVFDRFDTFRGSVLFMQPSALCAATLAQIRHCIFQEEEISKYWLDDDSSRKYAPHMTIAKHSRFRRKKVEKMRFDPQVYCNISESLCPLQSEATSIQLCRIAGRKKGEYYTIVAEEFL